MLAGTMPHKGFRDGPNFLAGRRLTYERRCTLIWAFSFERDVNLEPSLYDV